MRRQTARLTHGIWQYRRAHETNWYFVRPCTLYNTLIEFVPFLSSGMYHIFSFSSLLHLHLHWFLASARNWVTQWKSPAGSTSSFLPVERGKTYFIVPWMLSILLCIRWWAWNVCHDVVVAWLRLPYSFISTPPLCSLPHLHTLAVTSYTGIPVFLFLFYLLLSFIFFPHLHFCFVSQFFGDEWHCLTSMHLSLLPPPPPTRWWYPAFNSSLILFMVSYNPDWLLSIWRGFPSNL